MTTTRGKTAQFELAKFTAKRDLYYSEIEELFNLSSRIDEPDAAASFSTLYVGFNEVREKFLDAMELVNDLNFQNDPDFKPDYTLLKTTERFRCSIIEAANRLKKKGTEDKVTPSISVKLPKISLPEFDGDIRQWPLFFEKFNNIIHNNPSLDDLSRVHYLLGALKGKALDVCVGFTPTAANYPVLLNALKARYDNKRFLADSFFHQMLDLKPLAQESVSGLSNLVLRFDTAYKSLQGLCLPNLTDYFITTLLLSKLDPQTRRAFETSQHTQIPSYTETLKFLNHQVEALAQVPKVRFGNPTSLSHPWKALVSQAGKPGSSGRDGGMAKISKCSLCSKPHQIYKCPSFTKLSPSDRLKLVQERNWCVNCLSQSHIAEACNSLFSCRICSHAHHTLLHLGNIAKDTASPGPLSFSFEKPVCNFLTNFHSNVPDTDIANSVPILPTAVVLVETPQGNKQARFLIDSGSQRHFLSYAFCRKFQLPYERKSVPLEGMGNVPLQAIGVTEFTIRSHIDSSVNFRISALVTEKITRYLPPDTVSLESLSYLQGLPLADKEFFRPGRIDGILGAQIFGKIFTGTTVSGPDRSSQALSTCLGHIVLGDATKETTNSELEPSPITTFCIFDNQELNQAVQRFWELEEVPRNPKLSKEEKICEELYRTTTSRIDGRRYCVDLPFREFPPVLGDSRMTAENRLYALERKFKKDPQFHSQYAAVIQDYLDQGHLTPVSQALISEEDSHFIPHFAVLKNSASTPLRIVFDASAETSNGRSLNDVLFTGPKLQKDISRVLLSFRVSAIALLADIRQMYRNIVVRQEHRRFQRILWRNSPQEPLRVLQHNCVVFGLTSAPYLALRTVQRLAEDETDNFPLAATLANQHMYVDDLIVSLDSVPAALTAYEQLVGLFKAGGFKLTKWASNSSEVLGVIPSDDRASHSIEFTDSSKINETLKVLGLIWDPVSDTFSFKINSIQSKFTKRGIASIVARIWDPLGFLAPVVLLAKLFMKELWRTGLGWDEEVSSDFRLRWQQFVDQLPQLHDVRIPRHLGTCCGDHITLVGFADSSEKGYGAVVYLRLINATPVVQLLYAKSRVAPSKTISLPKLELCAAVLLSEIMDVCIETMETSFSKISKVALTDSTVTLAWIKNDSAKRETFVANRISLIERTLSPDSWFHVRSEDNIADHISRGLFPAKLAVLDSWFHGPSWLQLDVEA